MAAKSAAVVLCFAILDEGDVVDAFIDYHRSIGIDAFVGVDLGSTDGTLEKLAAYERRGLLHLTRLDAPDSIDQSDGTYWMEKARRVFGARWCVAADPDEFWVVPSGDLAAYLGAVPDAIVVAPRYNVVPSQHAGRLATFDDFSTIVRRPLDFDYAAALPPEKIASLDRSAAEALLRDFPPEILRRVLPKIAVRPEVFQKAVAGGHDVVATGDASRHYAKDAYVAHVPFRNPAQFRRKAENVARFVDRNLPHYPSVLIALHWIRLRALLRYDLIEDEFRRQMLDGGVLEEGLRSGMLAADTALSARLKHVRFGLEG